MTKPLAYTAFHLNMAFSSIEKAERPRVIEHCYWPLLRLAEAGFPIGIEATSYTLRAIEAVDPTWIAKFRALLETGKTELVGSGYTQMIAPLVPPEVTRWNLKLGLEDYKSMLGVTPKVALMNEQAYSPGIVPLYHEAGFEAIMMDWSEPSSHNRSWDPSYAKTPHMVLGAGDCQIPVIWSDAMSFQKFQRYAHGEIDAEEYLDFLSLQLDSDNQAFPLYTSDAEVFDYRPGRFTSEAIQAGSVSEFERIRLLLVALAASEELTLALPSAALTRLSGEKPIRLETAAAPVPVKKQRKYNIMRWAVTGRGDVFLNTHCWRLYKTLQGKGEEARDEWRALCGLWASDYRTHITDARWTELLKQLPPLETHNTDYAQCEGDLPDSIKVLENRRFLVIEAEGCHLVLNRHRGLAIQSFGFGEAEPQYAGAPAESGLVGTLAHGFYSDIAHGADFYTGHFIYEPAASHKTTDLVHINPSIQWCAERAAVYLSGTFETGLGTVTKHLYFCPEDASLTIRYDGVPLPLVGTFHFAHVTLNPRAFNEKSLYFKSHNGGEEADYHALYGDEGLKVTDHGAAVSRLVSSSTGLGMTGGYLELGDDKQYVRLTVRRTNVAGVGIVTSTPVDDSYFVRAAVSVQELDETAKVDKLIKKGDLPDVVLEATISLGKHL